VHCDSKTFLTTITELAKLYQKEKSNTRSRHEDEDGWMTSKRESVVEAKTTVGGGISGNHDRVSAGYDDWYLLLLLLLFLLYS
jgi:hypothetical protein